MCLVFIVKFDYGQTSTGLYFIGLAINCINFKSEVYFKIDNRKDKHHILVFIKAIFFSMLIFYG